MDERAALRALGPRPLPPADESRWGPYMRKLSERQQRFVLAVMDGRSNTQAATLAGAANARKSLTPGSAKQLGYKWAHDPAILDAIKELSLGRIRNAAPKAIAALEEAVEGGGGPNAKLRVKAASDLLGRAGLGIVTQTTVNATVVHKQETREEIEAEILKLAEALKLDGRLLLGYDPGEIAKTVQMGPVARKSPDQWSVAEMRHWQETGEEPVISAPVIDAEFVEVPPSLADRIKEAGLDDLL